MNEVKCLLYQMGKVGSSSINHVLHENGIKTLHAHWMFHDYPIAEFPTQKPNFEKKIKDIYSLRVITPIREPISRNISAFFRTLEKYCNDPKHITTKELQKIFIKQYNINYPDQWFELELMRLFDFNPFKNKFDYKKGYKIYKSGKHKIFIIRLEDTERVLSEAFYKFLGIKNAKMKKLNILNTKHMIAKYDEFKSLPFPEDFLDKNYNLKYVKHFYTDDEINRFKQKWMQEVTNG